MGRRKWRIVTILIALVLVIMPMTTLGATDTVDEWATKNITEDKKVWTIAFSHPLKESSIKTKTVYVEDERNRSVLTDVTLSNDKKSIIVTPKVSYQENITYRLHVSKNIQSEKGKALEKDIVLPFVLNGKKEVTKEVISNVVITPTAYASKITVNSNDNVSKVKANNKDMHYEGNNTYSLGMTGLESGDNVKIVAYDVKGKRIFSKDYKVN